MNLYAQSTFQKVYKGSGETYGYFAEQTADGGYILAGGYFIVKTDSIGQIIWSKGYYNTNVNCIHQTSDGGFILGGYFYWGIPDSRFSFAIKKYFIKINTTLGGAC